MSLPFKICPECGAEHVHTAVVCADCNVALELATGEAVAPAAPDPLPPASELVRLAAGSPWELERIALHLQEAGISCRVDAMSSEPARSRPAPAPRGAGARLALFVLPADVESARSLIQESLLEEASGDAPGAQEGASLETCPACGAPISAAAPACPDCGLEFVAVDVCSSCGAVLSAEATACASCGAERSREGAG